MSGVRINKGAKQKSVGVGLEFVWSRLEVSRVGWRE